jgi:spore coat protein A, manganese oxidase
MRQQLLAATRCGPATKPLLCQLLHLCNACSGGRWVVNSETWATNTIAASDVGENTYELWKIRGAGGWFHPVHIHLVDFYVLFREGDGVEGLQPYEERTPKDMINLYDSGATYALVR